MAESFRWWYGLMNRGLYHTQSFEAGAIESAVERKKAIRLEQGVGADQKVRRHACPGAASLPISLPGEACFESSLGLERAELDGEFSERVAASQSRRKTAGDLGPHNITSDQRPFRSAGAQRIPGSDPEFGIVIQEIKQHATIDGGNHCHFNGYSPRSSFMISSVRRPSFRTPKYLSNGSWDTRLVITK